MAPLRRVCHLLLLVHFIAGCANRDEEENVRSGGSSPTREAIDEDALARALARAWESLANEDFERARTIAADLLEAAPAHPEALVLAGQSTARLGDPEAALDFYDRLPPTGGSVVLAGQALRADLLLHVRGDARAAEAALRKVLATDPDHVAAAKGLADLLDATGRLPEATSLRLRLVRLGQFDRETLLQLGWTRSVSNHTALLDRCFEFDSDQSDVRLGRARYALADDRPDDALRFVREALVLEPGDVEARLLHGTLIAQRGTRAEFDEWRRDLPKEIRTRAETWSALGAAAERWDTPESAIRCYWEAVRIDPDRDREVYRLSQLLAGRGETNTSQPFAERAERLARLSRLYNTVYQEPGAAHWQVEAAQLADQLGRHWEACGWAVMNVDAGPPVRELLNSCETRLATLPLQRTVDSANPALAVDLSRFPLPRWASERRTGDAPSNETPSGIAFRDVAREAGIDFVFHNAPDPTTSAMRIIESTGGGVAVLDLDLDGWPDLHFTQGQDWPIDPDRTDLLNRTYRNRGDGTFREVTEETGLRVDAFSQGAAVGDVDGDGFPDLLVTNIGRNRLFLNNGDGTFEDASDRAGLVDEAWSTSAAVVDLDADGHPELYVVNYLSGEDVYTRICVGPEGRQKSCGPNSFPGSQDRLHANLGNGSFRDVTESSGMVLPDGKGLGIVAADFEGRGRPDVFVANDAVANFLLVNRGTGEASLRFDNRAVLRGVAFNADGEPQASMGIACDDADGDLDLDLFVTHFADEWNVLYTSEDGLFADESARFGLREPSWPLLGFGTQFLDAELDGDPDLVVVNGHVVEVPGVPFRMRPQFFRNDGGRFTELTADDVGPFFAEESLGRGVAVLDWDRDGREDVAVSRMQDTAALLSNRTPDVGRSFALRLAGTNASRDAIGTTVTVSSNERTRRRQLVAGDGYLASNERRLVFGLGEATEVDRISIRWPSGAVEEFAGLPVDHEFLAVEGSGRLLRLPAAARESGGGDVPTSFPTASTSNSKSTPPNR